MARPRHCLSATHGWPSLNNSQCSSPTLYTHTVYARGREGARENRRWEGRREQGKKRRSLYLCSAKAPLLPGSVSRRVYRRRGTSLDRVYECLYHVSTVGFFTIRKKTDSWWGCVAKVTASHLLMARPRHCLSATHGWPSLNNSQCSSPTLYTHTVYARGREGARENRRWEGRREQGAGGREEAMM